MDDETKLNTPHGPMTVAQALADPAAFVGGMTEERTYSLFVPFTPTILHAMLGDIGARLEPYEWAGRRGSLVTTHDPFLYQRLCDRFNHQEYLDATPRKAP